MNALSAIINLYVLMTFIATVILLHSFQKHFDQSARFFLTAEVCLMIGATLASISNLYPSTIGITLNTLTNCLILVSDLAVFLSIYSLHKRGSLKFFLYTALSIAFICLILELGRGYFGARIVTTIYLLFFIGSSLAILIQCRSISDPDLKSNRFIAWIGFMALGIAFLNFLRLLILFGGIIIVHRQSTTISVTLYSFWIAFNIFRYISYIALRITWVNPKTLQTNLLNQDLAKAIVEKDRLLSGLISSNRAIGVSALASTIAHQISQPLTAISLQAAALKQKLSYEGKDPQSTNGIEEISLQSDQLAKLVGNLRQLFNSQKFEFQGISLSEITQQIISLVQSTCDSKKILLKIDLRSDPHIYGDKIQLQQVIINLLNNAIDAIDANPSENASKIINVTINQNNEFGIIQIEDSGSGIDPKVLPSVFELYQSTKENGLGVGLWLCKTIIDRHRGTIAVKYSDARGACLEAQIPLYARENISNAK